MSPGSEACAVCANLIRMCACLDYFPTDVLVRDLLATKLHKFAFNHDHAKAIIEDWVDFHDASPKPVDLLAQARKVKIPLALPDPCPECADMDWVSVEKSPGVYVSQRCTCARGKALLAAEAETQAWEQSLPGEH